MLSQEALAAMYIRANNCQYKGPFILATSTAISSAISSFDG